MLDQIAGGGVGHQGRGRAQPLELDWSAVQPQLCANDRMGVAATGRGGLNDRGDGCNEAEVNDSPQQGGDGAWRRHG